ncbi:MAG: hypothetical protein ACYTFA_08250 [Planctomycetota bacterium]
MQFFNSHSFWFLEGIFVCLAIMGFKAWAEDHRIPMPFWKWLLLVAWMVLLGFTLAFIGTSLGEREVYAALRGGILFGIVVIVSGVALWRILMIGRHTGDTDASADS